MTETTDDDLIRDLERAYRAAQNDAAEDYQRAYTKKGATRQEYLDADRALQKALRLATATYLKLKIALAESAHAPQGAPTPEQEKNRKHLERYGWKEY